jgi:transcription elongation factor GreA-like protein
MFISDPSFFTLIQTAISFWQKVMLSLCGDNVSELRIFVSMFKEMGKNKRTTEV